LKVLDLHSMTGYGRGSQSGSRFRATVEIRSVNGRYLEVRPKLPRGLLFLEPKVRERIEKKVQRGVVDLTIAVQPLVKATEASVDENLAALYMSKISSLAKRLELSHGLTASSLLRLPGVVNSETVSDFEGDEETSALVLRALDAAMENLLGMRKSEGEKLCKVLQRELNEIREHRDWIHGHREGMNERNFRRMQGRVKELMASVDGTVEENRLYQEVAFYLDRGDITEELDRLGSHLKQCEETLSAPANKSVGKRLEFLMQEIGREVNTIGAKSDQAQVSNRVVEMKLTLEKIREQVQNLE
jgi:uncharacterized protein (TIGR00255 family)